MIEFRFGMYPVLFSIGKFKLYSFGSFIALGAMAAGLFLYWAARIRNLTIHHLFDTVLYTLLAGLIGARIGYYFLYSEQFQSVFQIFYFWQGGLLALSGLITGFLAFLYLNKTTAVNIWKMLDLGALSLLLGWGIGKIGCHLSACTIGRFTEGFLAVNGMYPVDLFSVIWALLLFAALLVVWRSQRLSDGVIFFLALEGFFLGELLIKTLRADFGEGIARVETLVYLGLIVGLYILFWKLHGPRFERDKLGLKIKNLVFRRR